MTIKQLRKMNLSVEGQLVVLVDILEKQEARLLEQEARLLKIEKRHDYEETMEMEASEQ